MKLKVWGLILLGLLFNSGCAAPPQPKSDTMSDTSSPSSAFAKEELPVAGREPAPLKTGTLSPKSASIESEQEELPLTEGVQKSDPWQYIVMSDLAFKTYVRNNPQWYALNFPAAGWGVRSGAMGNLLHQGTQTLDPAAQISWNDKSDNLLLRRTFKVSDPQKYRQAVPQLAAQGEVSLYHNGQLIYQGKPTIKDRQQPFITPQLKKPLPLQKGTNILAAHVKSLSPNRDFLFFLNVGH